MRVSGPSRRDGAAAAEMAVLAPILVFLAVIGVDFARVFYFSLTVANCARNGALYASDPYVRRESTYGSVEEAALADAGNLNDPSNPPTVSQGSGVDSTGQPYVEVTVRYEFRTITRFPLVPNTTSVERTVRMAQAPLNPSS